MALRQSLNVDRMRIPPIGVVVEFEGGRSYEVDSVRSTWLTAIANAYSRDRGFPVTPHQIRSRVSVIDHHQKSGYIKVAIAPR